MAVENFGNPVTLPANADLSSSQYCFVTVNSSGNVALTGDGEDADGVLQNDPAAASRGAIVAHSGIAKVKCGGVVTAGDMAASDSTGRVVTAISGDYLLGRVLATSTAANQIISVLLSIGHAIL